MIPDPLAAHLAVAVRGVLGQRVPQSAQGVGDHPESGVAVGGKRRRAIVRIAWIGRAGPARQPRVRRRVSSRPTSAMDSTAGTSLLPSVVRPYSTVGGELGMTFR